MQKFPFLWPSFSSCLPTNKMMVSSPEKGTHIDTDLGVPFCRGPSMASGSFNMDSHQQPTKPCSTPRKPERFSGGGVLCEDPQRGGPLPLRHGPGEYRLRRGSSSSRGMVLRFSGSSVWLAWGLERDSGFIFPPPFVCLPSIDHGFCGVWLVFLRDQVFDALPLLGWIFKL